MYGKGLIKGLSVTFKHFFQKNITQMYPEERPVLSENFHGSFVLTESKCIACSICVNACPNAVIKMATARNENKKRYLTSYFMDLQYCLFCGLCVESCPTDAINFNQEFELSCFSRQGTGLNLWPDKTQSRSEG